MAAEGFADRACEPDGSLRPRSRAGALHQDPEVVAAQAVSIARDGTAPLEEGVSVAVVASSSMPQAGQPRPGDLVRFAWIDLDEARRRTQARADRLASITAALA